MMRKLCWLVTLVLLPASNRLAAAQRYLEPEQGSLNEFSLDHVTSLRKTLLKDAARYHRARVVCVPSFDTRWVVTLVRGDEVEPTYTVEYAGFERQPGQPRETAQVRKVQAPIDREAAEAIQEVWLRMLREVRHPEKPRFGGDGDVYHFSRGVSMLRKDPLAPFGWESGQIWSPNPGSATGRLATLAEALRNYARASADDRPKLRRELMRDIDGLRAKLKAK